MKIKKYFNYKDWWNWVFWIILIACLIGYGSVSDWERWKWGYYSLDSIPYIIILILLGVWENIIYRMRLSKRLDKLYAKVELKDLGEKMDNERKSIMKTLDLVVKAERKFDLRFSDYIVCAECGTIAYGDGNCHCGKNLWGIWKGELEKDIKEEDKK